MALLANALVLQRWWPDWWTGKLGDAAWMIFAPFLAALALAYVLPRQVLDRRGAVGVLAAASVGFAFALVKAIPAANSWALQFGAALGVSFKLRLDSSDLLVLPVLAVAWWIWQQSNAGRRRPGLPWAALGLAGLALLADSPAPQPLGITCLGESGGHLYAVEESTDPKKDGAAFGNMLASDDGLSWDLLGVSREVVDETSAERRWQTTALESSQVEVKCGTVSWPVADPAAPNAQLYFVPGAGLYSSPDGGATLTLSLATTQDFTGMVLHPATGNLVLSTLHTLLVRTPDGEWAYGTCSYYSCQLLVTPTP